MFNKLPVFKHYSFLNSDMTQSFLSASVYAEAYHVVNNGNLHFPHFFENQHCYQPGAGSPHTTEVNQ
ncbi:MAG: hypothetical protein H6Q20_313 [Bacteroidetes bacterium]|nr:hypothetical protein [Bacteroidota bacterium]